MTTQTIKGSDVHVGDAITFCPGNKPIRVMRFDAESYVHPEVGGYRVCYDPAETGYSLFDDHPVWLVERSSIAALPVSAVTPK